MSQVCIRGVGCYVPEARLTNQAISHTARRDRGLHREAHGRA